MNIGKLKKKVTIQVATEAGNAYGEPVKSWSDFAANRWAEVNPQKGIEAFSAQRVRDEESIIFRLRYIAGVVPKMKLIYGGNDYDIISVVNDKEEGRELFLDCVRRS